MVYNFTCVVYYSGLMVSGSSRSAVTVWWNIVNKCGLIIAVVVYLYPYYRFPVIVFYLHACLIVNVDPVVVAILIPMRVIIKSPEGDQYIRTCRGEGNNKVIL
jgi:hypothetical protein